MGQRRKKPTKSGPAAKKPIEQYEHDEKRANNPHVGLVGPDNDPDSGKRTYTYDPHLDLQLVWACAVSCSPADVPYLLAKHS